MIKDMIMQTFLKCGPLITICMIVLLSLVSCSEDQRRLADCKQLKKLEDNPLYLSYLSEILVHYFEQYYDHLPAFDHDRRIRLHSLSSSVGFDGVDQNKINLRRKVNYFVTIPDNEKGSNIWSISRVGIWLNGSYITFPFDLDENGKVNVSHLNPIVQCNQMREVLGDDLP